jgi:hypothetical protein
MRWHMVRGMPAPHMGLARPAAAGSIRDHADCAERPGLEVRMRAAMTILLFAAFAGSVAAQGLRLPPQSSPAENQVQDLNRSMQLEQRRSRDQQQGQFEFNQLRQDLNRSQNFPSITGPGVPRGCPPGSAGC